MLELPYREYCFEVLFRTTDEELNEIMRISTRKVDYSFKNSELKIVLNLYADTIEKLRELTVGMLIPVEVLLSDPTDTNKYSLFECPLGKIRNFEITDIDIHLDYNSSKLLEYVITLNKPKL